MSAGAFIWPLSGGFWANDSGFFFQIASVSLGALRKKLKIESKREAIRLRLACGCPPEFCTMPSPQNSSMQRLEQPSLLAALPSSHSSAPVTNPSPHSLEHWLASQDRCPAWHVPLMQFRLPHFSTQPSSSLISHLLLQLGSQSVSLWHAAPSPSPPPAAAPPAPPPATAPPPPAASPPFAPPIELGVVPPAEEFCGVRNG